ncbi:hypothetical protein B0A50_02953 [Salinomyces thailandicus]|uniref:Ubiquitin-like domain-containing protein n=1 Tax=Salinomyces thailandicus TaxID=706561 RepID=A0A4U0U2K4_9PEZI|nr:hypothetical protein B0A50_02953 [Salinomyces thailandica]
MGCCQSTQSGPNDDGAARPRSVQPAALPHNSSQAAINQSQRSLDNGNNHSNNTAGPRAAPNAQPASQSNRPNKPIRAPSPVAKSPAQIYPPPPWTRSILERERASFFDTRVTGRQECWEALRLVCDMLLQGNVEDAQGVMDAANLSSPQGRVAIDKGRHRHRGGVYDERGELYDIPAWVVTDPQDLVEDAGEKDLDGASDSDADHEETVATEQQREQKGKGRAEDLGELLPVRCRLSDRGTDVVVQVHMKQKVAVLVREVQAQIGPRRLRLVYLGRTMMESKTLEDLGWQKGHVVNAMVFEGEEEMLVKKVSK